MAGCYKVPVLDGVTLTTSQLLSVGQNHEQMLLVRGQSWADAEDRAALFLRTVGIIPPREVGVHQEHHPTVPEVTVDLPADLSVWFEAVPQAQVVDAVELTVADLPARRWTVTIDPELGATFDCGFGRPNCIGFVVNEEGGTYVLPAGEMANIYQFDAVPDVIGWVFAPDEADLAEADTVFAALLAGLDTE
jgi:hypothetical protein